MIKFTFTNEQDKLPFTDEIEAVIREAVETALEILDWGDVLCAVDVTITDNEKIREVNKLYRSIDRETDVLSFPMIEFDEDGEAKVTDGDYEGDTLILGDIVLSLEKALSQSEEYGHSLKREAGFLALHSALHLMGFDHEKDEDAVKMRALEKEALLKMDLKRE